MCLLVEGVPHQVSFKIEHYHEIVHYAVTVSLKKGNIMLRIVDADFEGKRILYQL